MFRTLLIQFFAICTALIMVVVSFEIYMRSQPEKFYSYGWAVSNIIDIKIDSCYEKYGDSPVVAVFGDSLIEFYGELDINVVQQMANLRPKINFCNFSMSGTGLSTYIHRAMVSNSSKLNIVQNLFFICEGNDFSSFLLKNPNAEEEAVQSSDRTQSLLFDFFKSSYSLNFIYREIIKNYFLRKKIDPIQSASNAKTELANSSVSKNVYDRIPKDIMAKFEANLLNVSWFRVAMSNPDYFKDIHSPTEEGFKKQKNQLNKYISSLSTICGEESERCNHFILPHNYFILEESRKSWVRDFGFNYNNIEGKTKITNEMLINYNNVHYPNDLFQMEDYIPQDDHFLGSGTKKIAKFVFEKLGY